MRIISGIRRGHKLFEFEGDDVRPTTDRVKESVFNIIQTFIPDAVCLDMFAGSGALSFEAISRGAKKAVCLDKDKRSIDIIKKNANSLDFSDYCEIRNGEKVENNQLLKVKRMLLSPLKVKKFQTSRFIRRRSLAFGCGICCPSVTFAVENLPNPVFTVHFRSCEDWEAWERLSRLKGTFAYDATIQMGHRIHEESETSIIIGDNARSTEDYEMYCRFWPKWIAKILIKLYSKSQQSNNID